MTCRSCSSDNQTKVDAEINIHFPGLKGLNQRSVLVFPKLVICLDCGFTEYSMPETELQRLRDDRTAA
jgi:hypothetical protein